ncbi:MAG TPA: hypothetical protein VFP63_09285 [Dehalococcoidia bacterium]|nr:hypothetical protein [Dehalococcoidia bacterium]
MRLLLLMTAAAAWLAACGGDDPPQFSDAAPAAAQEALISEQDLSPGWREEPAGSLDEVDLAEPCDVLTPDGAFPSAAATASSPAFGTVDRRSAQSFAAVYESEDDASGAVSDLDARVESCRDDFLDEVRRLAEKEIEDTGLNLGPFADIDVSIEPEALDGTGDEAIIYHVGVDVSVFGTDREFNADITLVRNGQVISVLVYSAYGPTQTPEGEALRALLLGRLTAANDKLS